MKPLKPMSTQRGASLLVVLVLLTVLLLGAMSLSRLSETSTLVAGNVSNNETSVQAGEIGINTALAQLNALADFETDNGNWYRAKTLTTDATAQAESFWTNAPSVTVGAGSQFTIRYVVERLCSVAPATNPQSQCLLRELRPPVVEKSDAPEVKPPSFMQYRVTVRIEAPKSGRVFVQSIASK